MEANSVWPVEAQEASHKLTGLAGWHGSSRRVLGKRTGCSKELLNIRKSWEGLGSLSKS